MMAWPDERASCLALAQVIDPRIRSPSAALEEEDAAAGRRVGVRQGEAHRTPADDTQVGFQGGVLGQRSGVDVHPVSPRAGECWRPSRPRA